MAKPNYQHMKKQREAAKKARQQESEPGDAPAADAPDAAAETPVAPKP
jgi:hypothetical protein